MFPGNIVASPLGERTVAAVPDAPHAHRAPRGHAVVLSGGIAGGFTYTLFRFALPDMAVPAGAITALLVVVLTAPRGGLPLWMRLWLNLRGRLLLAAAQNPSGIAAELALAAGKASLWNVRINASFLGDRSAAARWMEQAEGLLAVSSQRAAGVARMMAD